MSNVKISALPAATTPLTGTELVPLVQSGVTSQVAVSNIKTAPAGSNTQVQFNNASAFGASASLTWDGTSLTATKLAGAHNGTVGATTPSTGAFTTVSATGQISGTKNDGVQGLFYGYCPDGAYVGTDAGCIQIGNSTSKGQFQYTTAGHVFIDNTYNSASGHIKLRVKTAGTPVVALDASDTGVAVTGTLSATTTGQVGTTLGVGGATPSASGAGITFPATQSASTDANTLDDYEEGTWTPSLGGTATYNGQTGTYTKIGNVVTLLGNISVNIIGTGSTTLISGLPFNAASTLFSNAGSVGYNASLAVTVASINAQISSSASQVNFGSRSITGSYTEITAIFQNSSRLEFTIVYRV